MILTSDSSLTSVENRQAFPRGNSATVAIGIRQLVHRYPPVSTRRQHKKTPSAGTGRELALDHLSLDIPQGGLFALLGPNGGGKSTLFKIIATMMQATSGDVQVMGYDVRTQAAEVRSHLGVLFQMPSLDVQLTAWENLRHQGHLYGLKGRELKSRIDTWLDHLGLADNRDDRVLSFSGGMRRRLELAKALLHRPSILLLDEPAAGLDPVARRDVWQHLVNLRDKENVTIALTTHMMDEADKSDQLAIINDGKLVAMDTPTNLKASIGCDVIIVTPKAGQSDQAIQSLRQRIENTFGPWEHSTDATGRAPRIVDGKIYLERKDGLSMLASLKDSLSDEIRSLSVGQPTLEDVFIRQTGRSIVAAPVA